MMPTLGDRIFVRDTKTMGPQTLVAFVCEIIAVKPGVFSCHVLNPYGVGKDAVRVERYTEAEFMQKWIDVPPPPPAPPPPPPAEIDPNETHPRPHHPR